MDIIRLLPDSVANQIAAGEVIQRPSSCLKELVENSLDAGASRIRVIVQDAGRTLLQVIDDGQGMSPTDVRMAFERHATSKIKEAADLFSLRTMGFRGEALASICSVAQVEVMTRRPEDELGTRLVIHGSQVMEQEAVQCPAGTNIKVKNLFFNVPVRRKFLKTDQTELRNLLSEFYRIVLVYPQVQFTMVSQDEILSDLPAGTDKQRIESVFGKSVRQPFTGRFVDIKVETDVVSVHGFVGKPESAGKNPQQYFFVNGRFMRHPYFHKAVMTAYEGMLSADAAPSYFIYFDINPESIDVNIHPTKTEIKFADDQIIFQILLAAVREALGKFNVAPSLDFDVAGRLEIPVVSPSSAQPSSAYRPVTTHDSSYNPFNRMAQHDRPQTDWQRLYEAVDRSQPEVQPQLFDCGVELSKCYQYAGRYILFALGGSLMIADQHRAHTCVLFNKYSQQMAIARSASQQLLFPEVWEVSPEDMPVVDAMADDLRKVGFDMERLDRNSFSIQGIPAALDAGGTVPALQDILASVKDTRSSMREDWCNRIALSLAYDTAISYGTVLSDEQMMDLIKDLLALKTYKVLPDGKAIVTEYEQAEIEKRF